MSIRNRLALILGSVLLPLLLGTGVVVAVVVPAHDKDQAKAGLRVVAQAVASLQQETCLDLAASARLVGGSVERGDAAGSALRIHLRQDVRFAAVSRNGTLLARAGDAPAGIAAQREVLHQCTTSPVRPAISPVAALSPAPAVLEYSATTPSTRGPVLVVVATPIDGVQLSTWRTRVGAAADVQLAAACPGGGVTATGTEAVARPLAVAAQRIFDGRKAAVTGMHVVSADVGAGHPCVVVAAMRAPSTLTASALTWSMLLLALIVGGVLVWWLARQLTQPVLALTEAAERAARGDLAMKLPVSGKDEVARLAGSFNHMARQLDLRMTEIQDSRDRLRLNVQRLGDALQRTHDLDGLLSAVCAIGATATESQRVTAWLVEGNSLVARVVWPGGAARAGVRRVPIGDSLPGQVVADGVVRRLVAGAREDVTLRDGPAMGAPLQRGEMMLGALVVERTGDAESYTVEDQAMLTSITGPAGIAIDNAMLHRQAQRMSVIDPLTGVGNLRMLTTTLAREVDRAQHFGRSVSLLLLDIDHFKNLTDTHGHGAGDAILHGMAQRVAASIRSVDTVARYGGEEFAVVCPELGPEEAYGLASHLHEAIRGAGFPVEDGVVDVRVSIGVASWPQQATTSTELMRAADAALSQAKASGRDRVAAATVPHR